MKILITRSNPISPDPRVEKIGRVLIAVGYSVYILGWDRDGSLPQQEILDGISIRRLPIRAKYGRGLGNLPQLMKWQWGLWRWLLQHREQYDVIHACDFDTILPAIWMKIFFAKRVIYDIFDFYADHLRATPAVIKKIIRRLDLWAIGRVDALILADDSRITQIASSKPRLTAVIYNSPEDFRGEFSNGDLSKHANLRLAYVGLLQVERGLLQMLTVLKNHPEWSLELAGFGGDEAEILALAANLPNVNWHGRVSYKQALHLSAKADVLFATYDPAIPNHKFSSPNKIYEAMMLGKPIIVAAGTNMDRIVAESNCGCIVTYGDIPALENTLQSLAADHEQRRKLGENARMAYETRYHWELMSHRLTELYEKALR